MTDTSIACFLSVVRTGSFTTSAQELSSTQQAVSRNVQALEEELGFTLLDRSGHTMTTTWEGNRFLSWCIEYEHQGTQTAMAAARLMGEGANILRLGWSDWTGCPDALAALIRTFAAQNPDCTLEVRQGSAQEMQSFLETGSLDVAILPEYNSHHLSGVTVSEPFMAIPLYVITSAATSSRFGFTATPTPAELIPMKQLTAPVGDASPEDVQNRARFLCAAFGGDPVHVQVMDNAPSVLSELACGPCYTIAPATPAAIRRGDLTFYPLDITAPLVLVQPQGSPTPWARLFQSFIRQQGGQS